MTDGMKSSLSVWVRVAFGTIGLLIGFVAGLSMTPVIGTILPLLFAAVGGGAGFFLTGKPENSREVGISITLMASMCLLGGIWGVHLRVGSPWKCFFTACAEPATKSIREMPLPPDVTEASRLAYLVAIRAELSHIEMPVDERKRVFQAVLKDKDSLNTVRDILHEVTSGKKTSVISFANQDPDTLRRMQELLPTSGTTPGD
jgi:hypothetical protein